MRNRLFKNKKIIITLETLSIMQLKVQLRINPNIQIYSYKKELQLNSAQIMEKISAETKHKYPITLKNNKQSTPRYAIFEFQKMALGEEHNDVLGYNVTVEREISDTQILNLHHNVCFSKKGYLIVAGMAHRITLLKYLTALLHPRKIVFIPRYLSKKETQEFTKKILKKMRIKYINPDSILPQDIERGNLTIS